MLTLEQIDGHCETLAKSGTEHAHQRAFFAWLACMKKQYPQGQLAFAIPNGGLRDKITAAKLQAEGVKSGVPDVFLPVSTRCITAESGIPGTYHGLFIEFKKANGTISSAQHEWIGALTKQGYACAVCYGWRAGCMAFIQYAQGREVKAKYL